MDQTGAAGLNRGLGGCGRSSGRRYGCSSGIRWWRRLGLATAGHQAPGHPGAHGPDSPDSTGSHAVVALADGFLKAGLLRRHQQGQ